MHLKKSYTFEKEYFFYMKFSKRIIILFVCLLPLFATVKAQESSSKKQKEIEKKKEKNDQEALLKYQKALKVHNKDQTKDTRKRMKQSRKESNKVSPGHKDFFLKRWFTGRKK
jgi:predicted Holliday junction resolvase-like endonuclease